jgi:hypothetical protein
VLRSQTATPGSGTQERAPGRNGEVERDSGPFQISEKNHEIALTDHEQNPVKEEIYSKRFHYQPVAERATSQPKKQQEDQGETATDNEIIGREEILEHKYHADLQMKQFTRLL